MKILSHSFYARDTTLVARELLGKLIVRAVHDEKILMARIVETEAYLGIADEASHAYGGKRLRNAPLFGPVGHAYVYFIYGMYECVNFVSRAPSIPAGGVLIRAVEPVEGIEYMQKLRHAKSIHDLTNGPGKLTQALAITRALNNHDVTHRGPLYVCDQPLIDAKHITITTRVGISRAHHELLRFYVSSNPFISKK